MRQDVLNMSGYEYVSVIKPILPQIDFIEGKYREIQGERTRHKNVCTNARRASIIAAAIAPFVFTFLFLLLNGTVIFNKAVSANILLFIFAVVLGVYILFGITGYIRTKKQSLVLLNETEARCQYDISYVLSQISGVTNDFVPAQYQSSFALHCICQYIESGRARNLGEALNVNVFEDDMYKMRMENMQQQLLNEAKMQTTLAAISAVANVSTAISAASTASSVANIERSIC